MMEEYKILTYIFIIITVILLIIGGIYSINNYESEKRSKLQDEANKNSELQYELMLQTIKDNSDYYVNFSKEFISLYEEFDYDKYDNNYGFYEKYAIEERLEYESNSDLIGNESYIRNEIGIIYVQLEYPDRIAVFDDLSDDGKAQYLYQKYCVVYIPDEYVNKESIATLNTKIHYGSLRNVKDNLFIASIPFPV
jgi:hypothetical protein